MARSRLQIEVSEQLSVHLGRYTIRENIRPDWLINAVGQRLELDFYIEELEVGIEIQGLQHYQYTPFFHGDYTGFKDMQKRDQDKQEICQRRGVRLFYIDDSEDVASIILDLMGLTQRPESVVTRYDWQNYFERLEDEMRVSLGRSSRRLYKNLKMHFKNLGPALLAGTTEKTTRHVLAFMEGMKLLIEMRRLGEIPQTMANHAKHTVSPYSSEERASMDRLRKIRFFNEWPNILDDEYNH